MQPLPQEPGFGNMLNREWALSQPHEDPQHILDRHEPAAATARDDMAVPAGYAGRCSTLPAASRSSPAPAAASARRWPIGYAQVGVTWCWPTSTWRAPRRPAPPSQRRAARPRWRSSTSPTAPPASRSPKPGQAATHGTVDILVNSAGSAFRSPAEEFPEDKLQLHPRSQSEGHVFLLPGVRRQDARAGQGQHHQHRLDRLLHRLSLGERLSRLEGRRAADDQGAGARMARPRRARQRHRPDADGIAADQGGRQQRPRSPPISSRRACCGRGSACRAN